jgi:hypothetical protein
MTWSNDQLRRIETSDDFRIAPYREDGATPGTLIWVWAVALDGAVFVRSANPDSRWFAAAVTQRAGIVETGGAQYQVRFEHVTDHHLQDRIDHAFVQKYSADPYLSPDVLQRSRARIARITPVTAEEDE